MTASVDGPTISMPASRRVWLPAPSQASRYLACQCSLRPDLDRTDLADHAVIDLLEADELGREVHLHLVRMLDDLVDFLFDRVLRHQRFPRRRLAEIGLGTGTADLAAGNAFDLDEHVGVVLQPAIADRLLDPPLPEDLHGADPAAARFRMIGRGRDSSRRSRHRCRSGRATSPMARPTGPPPTMKTDVRRVAPQRCPCSFPPVFLVGRRDCALFGISQEYV